MKLVADLHIHSHFSRATSANLTFEHLARWAQLKGIHVVGTGDIAHPGWLAEMREKLVPVEGGLFRLRDDLAAAVEADVPPACRAPVRFILAGEISNIYKRRGQTRKIHNVVFTPSFEAVERLQARLQRIGNIRADGRPILGLDSRDLLEIVLDIHPDCHLIPAHIWTPWFSLLGSNSGFDSVEECFADLTSHIFALETGLSSDPPMNWRVSALDRYALVSNSDAHSPEKLGREATLFDCELAYGAIFDTLKAAVHPTSENAPLPPQTWGEDTSHPSPVVGRGAGGEGYRGTIEFFPEEGKYHFDGHRACGIVWEPAATRTHNGLCPVCGKPVTVGVMHRVEALADRPAGVRPAQAQPFHSLVPLPEVLGEMYGVGEGSKQVQAEYARLLARLGPELAILREVPLEEIARVGGERLAEGIGRMRRREVIAQPGYDGEYGVIRVFSGANVSETQMGLFGDVKELGSRGAEEPRNRGAEEQEGGDRTPDFLAVAEAPTPYAVPDASTDAARHVQYAARSRRSGADLLAGLNPEQRVAVLCTDRPLAIVAGPGTGKTRTLTVRIAYLILEKGVAPEDVLAIAFTNKAAGEMRQRLDVLLGADVAGRVTIKTFHAFGAMLLREHAGRLGRSPQFIILADEDRAALLRQACPELKLAEVDAALARISAAKNRLCGDGKVDVPGTVESARHVSDFYRRYEAALRASDAVDFDDLILLPIRLLEEHPDVLAAVQARYRWISVDEYQDMNAAQYRLLRLLTASASAPPSLQPWGEQLHPAEAGGTVLQVRGATMGWNLGEQAHPPELGRGANLCVIGDPDQAIYGFRGADPRYFLRFEQDYPGARVLRLNRNYRSSQAILDAASQVIARNPDRKAVEILAGFADEVRLDVYRAATDRAEAEYVVHQIEQMVGGTSYFSLDSGRTDGLAPAGACSFADFAVLYRLAAQSRPLIEAFDRSGIPYQTVGQAPLTSHKAVREALAYLWLLHNPRSSVPLATVLAAVKLVLPESELKELRELPGAGEDSLAAMFRRVGARRQLTPAGQQRLGALAVFAGELEQAPEGTPVARRIERIQQFMLEARGEPLSAADAERLGQLALRAVPFGDRLADFLEATALQSETDAYDPRADRVTLMTLHAAKGLEFPVVFIVGCEEGLLPYVRVGKAADVEEERRLFYVGLTRAGRKLVLTHARKRVLFGQFMENAISRFVGDIEAALKEAKEMQYRPPERKAESGQLSLF